MKPQSALVLEFLEARGSDGLTQQQAIAWGNCYRLAARVSDLRAEGYAIDSELVTQGGVRFARYRLVTEPVQLAAFG